MASALELARKIKAGDPRQYAGVGEVRCLASALLDYAERLDKIKQSSAEIILQMAGAYSLAGRMEDARDEAVECLDFACRGMDTLEFCLEQVLEYSGEQDDTNSALKARVAELEAELARKDAALATLIRKAPASGPLWHGSEEMKAAREALGGK